MSADFNKQCLDQHNKLRAEHGCPPLTLKPELSAFAQKWANHLAEKGKLEHRTNSQYGENIYYSEGIDLKGDHPVNMWYKEIERYNFNAPKFAPEVGHFTQLIWKATKELGIGYAKRNNKIYVVCNYSPAGNVLNAFPENVPKKVK